MFSMPRTTKLVKIKVAAPFFSSLSIDRESSVDSKNTKKAYGQIDLLGFEELFIEESVASPRTSYD